MLIYLIVKRLWFAVKEAHDTISTDIHNGNWNGPVFSMACAISKFLCLGMSFPEAIRRSCVTAARLLKLTDKKNTVEVGDMADFAAFRLDTGHHVYNDAEGGFRLIPVFTVFKDKLYMPTLESKF